METGHRLQLGPSVPFRDEPLRNCAPPSSLRGNFAGAANCCLKRAAGLIASISVLSAALYVTKEAVVWSVGKTQSSSTAPEGDFYRMSRESLHRGIGSGAAGGVLCGLALAELVRRCIGVGYRHDHTGTTLISFYCLGATLGLCFGSLAGALYSMMPEYTYPESSA
ncbi:hypothetical protein [Martelella alba]|uniref:Uncharacterized protein n=1 Tax=Martelella alba TaxID=2590451 RepID=A0ABY2SKL3_9HYPH|nr:hypothetical protein [Martelella alba]TKI06114.1 hypothetical protein FCN80_11385 [Martelella alba]